MSSIFKRSVSGEVRGAISKFKAMGRIRPTAYLTVTGRGYRGGGPSKSLPIRENVYNFDGRPAPILIGAEITLEGDAGSLQRSSVKFKCYTLDQFDEFHEAMLKPGCEVDIEIGYSGPDVPSAPVRAKCVVYDFSFKINKDNTVDCEFKAVGQGTPLETTSVNAAVTPFAKSKQQLEYVTDYEFTDEKKPVASPIDYIDWAIQSVLAPGGGEFSPEHGSPIVFEGGNIGFAILSPDGYEYPDSSIGTGLLVEHRLSYVTFGFFIDLINKWCNIPTSPTQIIFKTEPPVTSITGNGGSYKIISCDPMNIVWLHPAGTVNGSTSANIYGALPNPIEPQVCLNFDLVKNIGNLNIASGFQNILFNRDFLRQVEADFAKSTDPDTPASFSVRLFIEKLLARISQASYGIYDLALISDPDATDNPSTGKLLIVNKREISSEAVAPLVFDTFQPGGDGFVRELTLTGKVPKAIQADAFAKGTGTTMESNDANATAAADGKTATKSAAPSGEQIRKAVIKSFVDDYTPEAFSGIKEFYEQLISTQDAADQVKTNKIAAIYPLEMSITTGGVKGFKFGDLVSAKNLPKLYRNANNGLRLAFTVTRITHTCEGNDWKTSLTTTCRLEPE
jgi:hypothetical protein